MTTSPPHRADRPRILSAARSGRLVDLLSPDFSALDIEADIAVPLSRIARFCGAAGARAYSVAQHCVVGSEAILAETGDASLALAFLVHDAHEVVIGDLPRPAAKALAHYVGAGLRLALGPIAATAAERDAGGNLFAVALAGLAKSVDRAVHLRAGLPPQLPARLAAGVKLWDDRMLATERADLLARPRGAAALEREAWGAIVDADPIRRRGPLKPWREAEAAHRWMTRFEQWRIRQI